MAFPHASKALARFTVLDLTRVRSGPTCVRQLADWGANVIKIETPPGLEEPMGGPREGPDFQNLHRNKRSMTLNLKAPEGLAAFKRMVKKADVVVENFRPDVKKRLGIDYKAMSQDQSQARLCQHFRLRPGRSLCRSSGLRPDRPRHGRPDVDHRAAGAGSGPRRHSDRRSQRRLVRGAGHSRRACSNARNRKKASTSTTSLLQAQIFMLDFQASRYLVSGEVAKQAGNNHPTSIPTGVFKTKDGHINIATTGERIWQRFCEAAEAPQLLKNPDYETAELRSKNRDALNAEIDKLDRRAHQRRMGRALQRSRRAVGPDLFHRSDVRRSAGQASRHRAERDQEGQEQDGAGRPAGHFVAHAVASWWRGRRSSASIPMRSSRSSDSASAISRRCIRRRRFKIHRCHAGL